MADCHSMSLDLYLETGITNETIKHLADVTVITVNCDHGIQGVLCNYCKKNSKYCSCVFIGTFVPSLPTRDQWGKEATFSLALDGGAGRPPPPVPGPGGWRGAWWS